jgi:hypothetical protein
MKASAHDGIHPLIKEALIVEKMVTRRYSVGHHSSVSKAFDLLFTIITFFRNYPHAFGPVLPLLGEHLHFVWMRRC